MRLASSYLAFVFLSVSSWAAAEVSNPEGTEQRRYLATGDSVPFGFSPLVDPRDPNNFVGYPEQVRDEVGFDRELNTACPGETTGSFISPLARDNGCHLFKSNFPLHDGFHPHEIQVIRDAAYLLAHPDTELVTVMLGANDLFLVQQDCQGDPVCIAQRLPAALEDVGRNLAEIFGLFRLLGFQGQLVAVQYYSTDFRDPLVTSAVSALN